jgi:DNA-directed RNA polymerase subunit RPC12/RpoP
MLIPAADYLTYAEAVTLYNELREAEIIALVKTAGPPSFPFGDGLYYQLLIEEDEAEAARDIVAEFEQHRTAVVPNRCPRCGSTDTLPAPHVRWWKRLFYAGTTLYQCQNCAAEFAT